VCLSDEVECFYNTAWGLCGSFFLLHDIVNKAHGQHGCTLCVHDDMPASFGCKSLITHPDMTVMFNSKVFHVYGVLAYVTKSGVAEGGFVWFDC